MSFDKRERYTRRLYMNVLNSVYGLVGQILFPI